MKKTLLFLSLLMMPFLVEAQTRVNASEIIAKINRGEAVTYKNAVIVGDLDLTQLQNMKVVSKSDDSRYRTTEYLSTVTIPLTFVNCTFKGDVLAYHNPDMEGLKVLGRNKKNEIYKTDFEKVVRFEDCEFEGKSAFKYSKFRENASFAGSGFKNEANFKYSKFSGDADFSDTRYGDEANFKYTDLPRLASFKGAIFNREANFKYTKFGRDADFRQANFRGLANFKYTKVADRMNLEKATFEGRDDFKYTKVNNRKTTRAELVSNQR
jgi:uncharacterized protein YjbI with pentapeptide repeats